MFLDISHFRSGLGLNCWIHPFCRLVGQAFLPPPPPFIENWIGLNTSITALASQTTNICLFQPGGVNGARGPNSIANKTAPFTQQLVYYIPVSNVTLSLFNIKNWCYWAIFGAIFCALFCYWIGRRTPMMDKPTGTLSLSFHLLPSDVFQSQDVLRGHRRGFGLAEEDVEGKAHSRLQFKLNILNMILRWGKLSQRALFMRMQTIFCWQWDWHISNVGCFVVTLAAVA